jgi:PadR family transcriptional regulator PadR
MEPGGALKAVSQLRRGVLEYCVLALLRDGPRYGVELVRELGSADAMVTSEGTIYPLLSRLRRDELVETSWQESPSGPPRRYYALTADGRRALAEFTAEWARFRDAVEHFIAADMGNTGTGNAGNDKTANDTSSGGPQ